MRHLHEFLAHVYDDVQFFPAFAHERLLRRFARLHLAPGEFPQKAARLARRPLANEKRLAPPDQRGHHIDHMHSFPSRPHRAGRQFRCLYCSKIPPGRQAGGRPSESKKSALSAQDSKKAQKSAREPKPFRALIVPGGVYGGGGAIFASENPIFQSKNRFFAVSAPENP